MPSNSLRMVSEGIQLAHIWVAGVVCMQEIINCGTASCMQVGRLSDLMLCIGWCLPISGDLVEVDALDPWVQLGALCLHWWRQACIFWLFLNVVSLYIFFLFF